MRRIVSAVVLNIIIITCSMGQGRNKANAWLIQPSAGYQTAGGDLEQRFGSNFTIGIGGGYKTASNWIFSLGAQYMFSDEVKNEEQLLSPIMSPSGNVFNQSGLYADVAVLQRGIYATADVSKTFDFLSVNANSGPNLLIGAGYITHWIAVNDVDNNTPQIMDEYGKGYDHLSGGILLKQSFGYLYLSQNRRINFKLAFEFMQGFTNNLRGFSYSTGKAVDEQRLDLLYGIRFQWMLPIYGKARDNYFYD